ncbi:MAG: ATP-binding protein [Bacteroidales bacterium]|nr:ATP-binding protein [Bacteroidales bacterium]
MDYLILQQVIADQKMLAARRSRGIKRLIDTGKHLKSKQISVISGIRRSGKSTLLLQLADQYPDFHYITFDDERLINFQISDFNTLLIELNKYHSSQTILIDEVRNITGWERFVRRLHDEQYKVFISGSNSKLLSSELATHLTGRYIKTELFPFSFPEYLQFKQIDYKKKTTENLGKLSGAFDGYLSNGGFPEFLFSNDSEFLHRIYEDVIYRDLIVRFGIKNVKGFKNLVQYLFTNFTRETNYNSLAGILGFNSTTSVRDYVSFLSESYLVFELYRYDYSLKKQYQSNKKIYVIDNGLRNAVSFRTSQDNGRMLENLVFIELKRRGLECWFYKTKNNLEVDFIWFLKEPQLAQVCYDLTNPVTYKRETNALETAMKELSVKSSVILSYNERKEIKTPAGVIRIIPVPDWLTGLYF